MTVILNMHQIPATGVPANRLLDTFYSGLDHLQVERFLAFITRETTDPAKAQEFAEAIEVVHSAWLISNNTE